MQHGQAARTDGLSRQPCNTQQGEPPLHESWQASTGTASAHHGPGSCLAGRALEKDRYHCLMLPADVQYLERPAEGVQSHKGRGTGRYNAQCKAQLLHWVWAGCFLRGCVPLCGYQQMGLSHFLVAYTYLQHSILDCHRDPCTRIPKCCTSWRSPKSSSMSMGTPRVL